MTYNWIHQAPHRHQVAQDTGQWLGLLDENFHALLELPAVGNLTWPKARGAIDSVSMTMRVRTPSGGLHSIVQELVAENLGKTDTAGRLIPITGPARFIRRERPHTAPRTMRITHVTVDGDAELPHTITIHGVTMTSYLDLLPCPSNPLTWTGEFTRFTRDWIGDEEDQELFRKPRDLAPATIITVADGASVQGPAATVIHKLITDSINAAHRIGHIAPGSEIYAAILEPSQWESPRIILRPTDQTIWKEVADAAMVSGVGIHVELWCPGDPVVAGKSWDLPTIVITIRQEGEIDDDADL